MATIPTQPVSPSQPVASGQGAIANPALPQSGRHGAQGQQSPTFQDLLAKSQGAGPTQNQPTTEPDSRTQAVKLPNTAQGGGGRGEGGRPVGVSSAQLAAAHLGSNSSTPATSTATTPSLPSKTPEIADLAAGELKLDISRSLITQQASQNLTSDTPSHFEQNQLSQQQADDQQTENPHSVAKRLAEGFNSRAQATRFQNDQPQANASAHTPNTSTNPTSSSLTSQATTSHADSAHDATQTGKSQGDNPIASPASLLRASAGTTLISGLHAGVATNSAPTGASRATAIDPASPTQSASNHQAHKPIASPSRMHDLVSKKPQISHAPAQQDAMASTLSKLSQSLAEALRSGGQLSFRISPGTLGQVSVSLTPHADNPLPTQTPASSSQAHPNSLFDLTLTASDPTAAHSLREQIESLRTSLQEKGITIASVSILTEQETIQEAKETKSFKHETLSRSEDPAQRALSTSNSSPNHPSNSPSSNSENQSSRHHAPSQNQHQAQRPPNASDNSLDLGAPSGTSLASLMPLIRAGLVRLDAVV